MKITLKKLISKNHPQVVDFVADRVEISKAEIKRAMIAGALWICPGNGKKKYRLRRAKSPLKKGDRLEFYYDQKLLKIEEINPELIAENKHYGVWYKPAGLLSQGTKFGDSHSILRKVEQLKNKEVFLIHRLDREASGLMVIGYSKNAARGLSKQWQSNQTLKKYQIEIKGLFQDQKGSWTYPLDEKSCRTDYLLHSSTDKTTLMEVELKSGRYHQIRRHATIAGFPVMGDPKYGKGNKNESGLKLVASELMFHDPFLKKKVHYTLPEKHQLFDKN